MKKSLHRLFVIGVLLISLFGVLASVSQIYSTEHFGVAAQGMDEAIESINSAQRLRATLNFHHRQALLAATGNRTSDADGVTAVLQAKRQLLGEAESFVKYVSTFEEEGLVQKMRTDVAAYLNDYDRRFGEGLRGSELYRGISTSYEAAVDSIQEVIDINVKQARELHQLIAAQDERDKNLAYAGLGFLFVAIGVIFSQFNRLIYKPLLALKQSIAEFELSGKPLKSPVTTGALEITEIATMVDALSTRLNQARNQQLTFLSAIAHDLRNPLSAIKMSAESLTDAELASALSTQEKLETAAIISRQATHMNRLVDDLLDTTRIEAGQMEMRRAYCDARELLKDAARLHANSEKHPIKLMLPEKELRLFCDRARMSQVFNNLLSNAIKYSPDGGEVEIEAKIVKAENGSDLPLATISVRDHGLGIDPNELEKIFEPFRRSSATRESIPGVGLGLSVTRKIVRAHDGDMKIFTALKKGSLFIISLPLALDTELHSAAERSSLGPKDTFRNAPDIAQEI